jgi:hypothetical protein
MAAFDAAVEDSPFSSFLAAGMAAVMLVVNGGSTLRAAEDASQWWLNLGGSGEWAQSGPCTGCLPPPLLLSRRQVHGNFFFDMAYFAAH